MERCLVNGLVLVCAATLSACEPDDAVVVSRYNDHPLSMDEDLKVTGCDGYTLGTVRVDKATGSSTVCMPLRAGCSSTKEAGCEEGTFSTRFTPNT